MHSSCARVRLAVCYLTASACLACGSSSEPSRGGPVRDNSLAQTDSTLYRLQRTGNAYRATAVVTYVNRTGSPVYYARCGIGSYDGPLFHVRRTGPDSTRKLWNDISWACLNVPTGELPAGDSLNFEVPLGAYDQPTTSPPIKPEDLVGLMRVELHICANSQADSDRCTISPLPQPLRQSNAFDVRY